MNNSAYHCSIYKKLQNYYNWEEKNFKSKYYCNLIEDAKNEGVRMWRATKDLLTKRKKAAVFAIFENGKHFTDSESIAKVMDSYFASIDKMLSKSFQSSVLMYSTINNLQFHLTPIDVNFVSDII